MDVVVVDDDECPICHNSRFWEDCTTCGGEGFIELYDLDPMWYDEDELQTCDVCDGKGGFWDCPTCALREE